MAKWDVKDGFWRLDAEAGKEWNFAYVLPQKEGEPVMFVVPTSLQMGWIESPGYLCAASETAHDVAEQYVKTPLGSLPTHKFLDLTRGSKEYKALPTVSNNLNLRCLVEVFFQRFYQPCHPHFATAVGPLCKRYHVWHARCVPGQQEARRGPSFIQKTQEGQHRVEIGKRCTWLYIRRCGKNNVPRGTKKRSATQHDHNMAPTSPS